MVENKSLIARMILKRAVIKVLIRIQAYKASEKIKRDIKSRVKLSRIIKKSKPDDSIDDSNSSYFDEEDDIGVSMSGRAESKEKPMFSRRNRSGTIRSNKSGKSGTGTL